MNLTDYQTESSENNADRPLHSHYDLTSCDREPVRFPGAILPHGVLLVLSADTLRILGASANTDILFDFAATDLLGADLAVLFDAGVRETLGACLSRLPPSGTPQLLCCSPIRQSERPFAILGHRSGETLILECEPMDVALTASSVTTRLAEVHHALSRVQAAVGWRDAMAIAVDALKHLTACDSVLGVCFLEDGSAHAVAESREDFFPSFLDKRFPRSDVPEPGRQQMILMPVQYVPDLRYEPVPVLMAASEEMTDALDLGRATLRSISPICRRFYQNFGAQSRLLLALVNNGRLWGFINCLSQQPHVVAYPDRLAYQTFIDTLALLIVEKQQSEQNRQSLALNRQISAIITELMAAGELHEALKALPERLLTTLDSTGVVLALGHQLIFAGVVPEQPVINALIHWLKQQAGLTVTDQLGKLFEPARAHGESLCGLLGSRLMDEDQYLLVFRPEWRHEVNWAGNPEKPVELDESSGEMRLTPRVSFDEWKKEVRGRSRPWLPQEQEAFADLQQALVLAQSVQKNRVLQGRLQDSNLELESFAYVVSHDLQEPLRGIMNFAQFLREGAGERLSANEQNWLSTILRLSERMAGQIDALLQYSRANQQPLELREVDLGQLMRHVLQDLASLIAESGADVAIRGVLAKCPCDPVRTQAVFENLISNAIKYNDKAEKRVEVGCCGGTIYVRDNGIGISPEHQDAIFTIFRRLHGRNDYGGGTGAGLTIARKHVERQGGRLWLESIPGHGTTFYFTLAPGSADQSLV